MPAKDYSAKADVWLVVGLAGAALLALAAAADVVAANPGRWPLAVLLIGTTVLAPVWLLIGTRYLLDDEQLTIFCGPFRWRVPLAEISAVTPTRNALSSPALSLDRLRIDYGKGCSVLIAPTDKSGFLRAVSKRSGFA